MTTFHRAPFEIVDDGYTVWVKNAGGEALRDVTIVLGCRDDHQPETCHTAVLGPGHELPMSCVERFVARGPAQLAISWQAPAGPKQVKTITL